ncbi:DMT family transporter [Cohnella abietis]|uniref:Multidrug resistance protein YkkC n=1 Tax=Cohnella abietis TaxID=2507935 RepID=A0A3T1DDY6_9BACL|nr:multidrug efflux SMR transporter [Cohnella abietis]BBI36105.1 multidrug resistance protein YkkC [Cohnella abietis]
MNRYWLLLGIAGLCEIGWVSGLKNSTTVWEWTLTIIGVILSFLGLIYSTRTLPVGTTYAVFTGIGAAGTVLAESIFYNVPFDVSKLVLIVIMIIGIAGLKMSTTATVQEVEK